MGKGVNNALFKTNCKQSNQSSLQANQSGIQIQPPPPSPTHHQTSINSHPSKPFYNCPERTGTGRERNIFGISKEEAMAGNLV